MALNLKKLISSVVFASVCCVVSVTSNAEQKLYFVHNDHLGTPQLLTDENQTIVWQADYTPFGEAVIDEDPDGDGTDVAFNLRFPGQYFDKETGLHYNLNRYKDPTTGRYTQSDPIGLAGGINTYAYVGGNPINFIDPEGLQRGAARRPNAWNNFQRSVGGLGLSSAQIRSLYHRMQNAKRQALLNQLGKPTNPELHEALGNLPDPSEQAMEDAVEDLKCNDIGQCMFEVENCTCPNHNALSDPNSCPAPAMPAFEPVPQEKPGCYCVTEIVYINI